MQKAADHQLVNNLFDKVCCKRVAGLQAWFSQEVAVLHLMVFRLVQIQVRGKGGGVPPADLNVSQATAALATAGNKSLDACCLVSRSLASGCVRAAMVLETNQR